jgi:large subunit ribosomal protein L18
MAEKWVIRRENEFRRQRRVRKRVIGTGERPRLSVFRSINHIYAQIVDDEAGHTLVSCSSLDKDMADKVKSAKTKSDISKLVGESLAQRAKERGVEQVVFDRNRYRYHGRVKALADGAREGGLQF